MIKYPNGRRLVIVREVKCDEYTPYFTDDDGNLYISYANEEADATIHGNFIHEIFEADEWQPKRKDGVYSVTFNSPSERVFRILVWVNGAWYGDSGTRVFGTSYIRDEEFLSNLPSEFKVQQ